MSHFFMQPPPAIIFVNADLNATSLSTLQTQLYINDTMSDTEFDARVNVDPNYPTNIHLQGLRILVVRKDFHDLTNRALADVVIFVKQGLATILKNNLGPPGLALPIGRLTIFALLRAVGSAFVAILPGIENVEPEQDDEATENFGVGLGGIFAIEAKDASTVHQDDPDEDDNLDFINRK